MVSLAETENEKAYRQLPQPDHESCYMTQMHPPGCTLPPCMLFRRHHNKNVKGSSHWTHRVMHTPTVPVCAIWSILCVLVHTPASHQFTPHAQSGSAASVGSCASFSGLCYKEMQWCKGTRGEGARNLCRHTQRRKASPPSQANNITRQWDEARNKLSVGCLDCHSFRVLSLHGLSDFRTCCPAASNTARQPMTLPPTYIFMSESVV